MLTSKTSPTTLTLLGLFLLAGASLFGQTSAPASRPQTQPAPAPPESGPATQSRPAAPRADLKQPRVRGLIRKQAAEMIAADQAAEALPVLEALDRAQPGEPATLALIAEAHYAKGDPKSAVQFFERSLEKRPEERKRAFNLGRAYIELEQFDRATEVFLAMLHDDDSYLRSKGELGMGYLNEAREDHAAAERAFARALKLDPANYRARYKVGIAQLQAGEAAQARQQFEEILAKHPLHHGAAYNLSLALLRLGLEDESQAARDRWQRIRDGKQRLNLLHAQLRLNSGDASVMTEIAEAYAALADWENSYNWYRRAIQREPENAERIFDLAAVLEKADRSKLAEGIYTRLNSKLTADPNRRPLRIRVLKRLIVLSRSRGDREATLRLEAELEAIEQEDRPDPQD